MGSAFRTDGRIYGPTIIIFGVMLLICTRVCASSDQGSDVIWIRSDAVQKIPGQANDDFKRFLPVFVFSDGGCFPAAAIDAEGRIGEGLPHTSKMNGGCLPPDQANIYTHNLTFDDRKVYAYALYFPKDGGDPYGVGGHRHDWEYIMVWTHDHRVVSVTFLQHSGWYTLERDQLELEDEHAVVYVGRAKHGMYHVYNQGPGGILAGICYFCDTRQTPGIRWLAPTALVSFESLAESSRALLMRRLCGRANSPFRPDRFLSEAEAVYSGEKCRNLGCRCRSQDGQCPGFP